jgi:hypothetical protein
MVNHYSIVNKCLGKGMSMPRMGGRSIVKDRKSKNYDNPLYAFYTNKNRRLKKNKHCREGRALFRTFFATFRIVHSPSPIVVIFMFC